MFEIEYETNLLLLLSDVKKVVTMLTDLRDDYFLSLHTVPGEYTTKAALQVMQYEHDKATAKCEIAADIADNTESRLNEYIKEAEQVYEQREAI